MGYIIAAAALFFLQLLSYLGNQKSLYPAPEFEWTAYGIGVWIGGHLPLIIGVILIIVGGVNAIRKTKSQKKKQTAASIDPTPPKITSEPPKSNHIKSMTNSQFNIIKAAASLASRTVSAVQHFDEEESSVYLCYSNATQTDTILFSCFVLRALCIMSTENRQSSMAFSKEYVSDIREALSKKNLLNASFEKIFNDRTDFYDRIFMSKRGFDDKLSAISEEFEYIIMADILNNGLSPFSEESPLPILGIDKTIECHTEVINYTKFLMSYAHSCVEHVMEALNNPEKSNNSDIKTAKTETVKYNRVVHQNTTVSKKTYYPILIIALFLSLGFNIYYLFRSNPSKQTDADPSIQISQLEKDLADATAEKRRLNTLCEERAEIISGLKEENTRLSALVRVYDKNTVLICSTSPSTFHKPDCEKIDPTLCETVLADGPFGASLLPCRDCYGDYDIYVLNIQTHTYHNLGCTIFPAEEKRAYLTHTVAYHENYFSENGYKECRFCW